MDDLRSRSHGLDRLLCRGLGAGLGVDRDHLASARAERVEKGLLVQEALLGHELGVGARRLAQRDLPKGPCAVERRATLAGEVVIEVARRELEALPVEPHRVSGARGQPTALSLTA